MMNLTLHNQNNRKKSIAEAEWQARVELAAAYRIFDLLGWAELIFAHLSLRVPGTENHFLINPYGLLYDEVCASNLVKIDLEGNLVSESNYPINPAGFITHGAIHSTIPGAHCVFHAHSTAGMAVASSRQGLSMTNIYAAQLHGNLAYHDFEGLTLYPDERQRLLRNIGNKKAAILRNHGLFAIGKNVIEAFNIMWLLNRACEIQVAASAAGELIPVSEDVQRKCARDSFHFNSDYGAGKEVFDALVRRIDQIDPSFKY
jgi:ribulose-5-phosphate 4-epimerase/fuculose-1-phosphate aldolase